jgi:hypothetical protein
MARHREEGPQTLEANRMVPYNLGSIELAKLLENAPTIHCVIQGFDRIPLIPACRSWLQPSNVLSFGCVVGLVRQC